MKKKAKGFTLIELIVVIAVIGVLAAILVPAMMGYIRDAKIKTANKNAHHLFSTLATYYTKLESSGEEPIYAGDGENPTVNNMSIFDFYDEFPEDISVYVSVDSKGYVGVIFDAHGVPIKAAWSESNSSSAIVGCFPEVKLEQEHCTWDNWYSAEDGE